MSKRTLLPWQTGAIPSEAIEHADVYAVQALAEGRAGPAEQARVWAFLQRFCGCGRMSFWPGGEDGRRATDFAEGKRFVGDQLRRIAHLRPSSIPSRGEPPPMPGPQAEVPTTEVTDAD